MSLTKERILDAAERLFARQGLGVASLRAITAEAGVNLAAVNYHFTSKESLIRAVLRRRIGPVNRRRLEMLTAAEAAAGDAPVPLGQITRAFLEPVIEFGDRPVNRALASALVGRLYHEPSADLVRSFTEELRTVAERFTAAYRRALPDLPPEEIVWRIHFMVGGMAHTLAAAHVMEALSGGLCDAADLDGAIRRLTAFVSAGFAAPSPGTPTDNTAIPGGDGAAFGEPHDTSTFSSPGGRPPGGGTPRGNSGTGTGAGRDDAPGDAGGGGDRARTGREHADPPRP